MQYLKAMTFCVFIILTISVTFAKQQGNIVFTTVPFQNVSVPRGDIIQASFAFGTFSEMFCYENNFQAIGIVTWPFKGSTSSGNLNILLSTKPDVFQGEPINTSGTLTILNNQQTTLGINCLFTY